MNNIFVGNLSFKATKDDVVKLFEPFGTVANAVIMERKKGKSRGYGFVDMPDEEQKNAAIAALQGKEFMWRVLSVSPVIPKVKSEAAKKFKPAKKEWKSNEGQSIPEKKSESKYYSKFDGPPKPWRKASTDSKLPRKDNKGSRPYYGKKDGDSKFYDKESRPSKSYRSDERTSSPSKPPYKKFDSKSRPFAKREGGFKAFTKPGGGFKMAHKVSGVSRTKPK